MPQFNYDQDNQSTTEPSQGPPVFSGKLTTQDYKHAIVHSREHDVSSLLTTISGFSYNVDYYSQVLGSDDEPTPFDPKQPAAFQQYQKIDNYELKLQGSISQSYDPTDNRLTAQGTALTYPYLKPNVGDAFIGDIGDGKAGLFTVIEALKKTRFKQTTYEIQFELSYIVDKELFDTIETRTVHRTFFNKDYIRYGMDPVLTSERYNANARLEEISTIVLEEYLSEFFSHQYSTLLVPSNNKGVYDPFVIRTMLSLFDVTDHPTLAKIKQLNVDNDQFDKYITVWSVLLRQQIHLLDNCFSETQVVPARSFSRNPHLRTVAFSGIDLIVLPLTRNPTVDDVLGLSKTTTGTVNTRPADESVRVPKNDADESLTSIPNVEGSPQYIFTQAFYNDTSVSPTQSDLENLVKRYLNKEHLDFRAVMEILVQRDAWTSFERFYLLPVLLILAIHVKRSL